METRADAPPRLQWIAQQDWSTPAAALKELKASRGLHQHRVVELLERGQYQLVTLEAPDVPRADWKDATRWMLQERVDFPVDTAALDVLEIPADQGQRRKPGLIAVAAPRALVLPLVQQATQAGTPLTAIDVAETALRNISALLEEPGRGQALLHVGEGHSCLVVTAGGELLLSRQMEASLATLGHADPDVRQQAFERTSLELQRTLDGFERSFTQVSLSRVLVAPGQVLEDFMAYVRELLYVPVLALEPGAALDLSAAPELADPRLLAQYLIAVGAALRGETR
ncbi:agglutinin biogenesis protein MshI [Pelomonas sp. SE-A7]|uniref:type IV pilus biogenesis protein PilM n=1 Tax=Pelomonas sp. SE-A7 TaxID=3054953 RepID=UPI00259C95BA|nr:agglutinin biogenesis protein MshI [Pelomonas sp. SE-A7]MDM4767779.1 agglutinin biogenesis protein MshI [Pelomonas sp. SE-A7]